MNILEQTEALKDLPDQALIKEMQMPTGMAPPVFITAELKRRQRMRDEFKRREAQDMPTVAEEVVMAAGVPQGGIADAARSMAPKSSIAQNTGMNEMMPAAATRAPQRMAEGGIMKLREGGKLVKVGNARFYAFPDGEVYVENPDGSRESVTDPRVLGVVRGQANVAPERQESAAPLGSEVLREAAPQAPSLESAISSDRSFNPQQMEVTDTRPSVPPSLGMGGERPATLTDSTQTAINQQQALIDAMSPEFDTFGGDPLARAEQRSNLSEPSISDVSPTYEGGEYTNADAIRNFNERMLGKAKTPQDMAEERLIFSNMNLPPDSPFAEYAGVDDPETSLVGYLGGKDYMDESEDFYNDISKNLLPPQASRGFDPLAPLAQERAARAVLAQQARLKPVDLDLVPESSDSPSKMEQMMQSRSVADNQGRPMGEAAAALAAMTGQASGRDPSDLSAMSIEDTITTLDPTQGYSMPQGPDEQSDIGFTEALTGSTFMDLAGSGMDALKAGQQPNLAAAKEAYGDLQMARSIREAEEGSLGGVAPTSAEAAKDIADAETQAALTESVIDMTAPTGTPTLGGGDPALEQGIASALQAASTGNVITTSTKGGGGGGIVPTGGAATGLEARIAQMLSDREKDRETDKYMALAQAGLALMASKNPTLGGAIGEAGLAGVGALRKAKSQYDADILGLMGLEEKARSSRLSREAALAKANRPKAMTGTEKAGYFDRASELEDQIAKIQAQLASGKQENPVTGLMTDDMTDEAKALLERQLATKMSQMNKYYGIANPQLANVQTVNPS